MKKITCALLSIFLITPCMANIHINPDAVVEVIAKHFSSKRNECIREYNTQLKASNGSGIAASKLWNVCAAGGLDIKQPADKEKCRTFVNELTRRGTVKFYEVCDKHKNMIANGTGRCIDNVFDGIKVTQMIATGLAKEYARVKYADNDLTCNKTIRQSWLDDYIQCTSHNSNKFYEFKFDSVTSTTDWVIDEGIESGICKIYDVNYTPFGSISEMYLGNGQKVRDYESWPAACETTDASKCSKINETMQKFSRTAKIGSTGSNGNKRNACIIDNGAFWPSDLRTAFGIDNYIFKKSGIQLNATTEVRTQVCAYVSQNVKNPAITSCVCNDGYVHLYYFDSAETDDVLTCTINNKTVDFVFDDLSEAWDTYDKSGREAMNCIAWGGTFTGKTCMGLDEKMCNKLRDANAQSCPECKKIQWNDKAKVCELPASVSATNLKKGLNYTAIVGGAAVGVVITVGSLGTASAPTALILTGLAVETLGAGIELKAQIDIDRTADEFLLTSQKCKSASCAEKLVKQNLQRLSNVASDMQVAERNAVDKELARLVGLLPNDSQLLIDIIGGDSLTDTNQKSLFDADSWEPEQVWRAVGVALQMTTIFASVGKWVLTKAGVLAEILPETTVRLTTKAKISRTELQQVVNDGKEIKTSSGKKLVIQLFRRSEEIAETEIRIGKTLDNMFGQKLTEISRMRLQQENLERDFIARNKGMLFHGSATDYKDGTVEALSQAWQIHTVPNAKGLLFADPDFYTVKSYASNGVISASVKDFTNTHIRLPIPKKYADKFKDITHGNASITLSDRPRKYGYVYAVKPDGFRSASPSTTYMMIEHDVERIDRIAIPLDTDVIFVREGVFTDHTDARGVMILKSELTDVGDGGLIWKMAQAARNIDNDKNVLKNLQIYEECLEKLAKMIQ